MPQGHQDIMSAYVIDLETSVIDVTYNKLIISGVLQFKKITVKSDKTSNSLDLIEFTS